MASVAEKLAEVNFELQRAKETIEFSNLALKIYFESNEYAFLSNIGKLLLIKIKMSVAIEDFPNALMQCDRYFLLLDRH